MPTKTRQSRNVEHACKLKTQNGDGLLHMLHVFCFLRKNGNC